MRIQATLLLFVCLMAACQLRHSPLSKDASPTKPPSRAKGPAIMPVGKTGSTPDAIWFRWQTPVTDVTGVAKGLPFTIVPETAGSLEFLNKQTLVFRPAKGFKAGTKHRVTLKKWPGAERYLRDPGPWTYEFHTPDFELLSISPQSIDYQRGRVSVNLHYSADVELGSLPSRTKWIHNDVQVVRRPRLQRTSDPRVVRATLHMGSFRDADRLTLSVAEGVKHRDAITAGASQLTMEIGKMPTVAIDAIVARRSTAGTIIDVYCNDEAGGRRASIWDEDLRERIYVSRRCEPDLASVKDKIVVSPKVAFRVTPRRGGFRLHGDFKKGRYTLSFRKGLKTTDSGVLNANTERQVDVKAHSPRARFLSHGRYLPKSAWASLPVEHVNVKDATLSIRHVPRSNLVFWMAGWNEEANDRQSDLVKSVPVGLHGPEDQQRTTWLDVRSHVPEPRPGVYQLTLSAGEMRSTRRLLLTDINIVAKRASPKPGAPWSTEILVWALDAHTNNAMPAVDVDLMRQSGFKLASCRTDQRGGCLLRVPSKTVDPSKPFALIASKGSDFTYLKYDELFTKSPDDASFGDPYLSADPYRAAMYTDRGVYRPGEEAHFVAIIRQASHRAPTAGVPVVIEFLDPARKVVKRVVRRTNNAGMISGDIRLQPHARTGRYHARVTFGGRPLGEHAFLVETIVPERMEVSLTARPTATPG